MLILEWLASRSTVNQHTQLLQRKQELANKITEDVKQSEQRSQNYNKAAQRLEKENKYLSDQAKYKQDAKLYINEIKNLENDRKALLAGDKDIQTRMVNLGNHWRLRNLAMIEKYITLEMHVGTLYTFYLVAEDGNDLLIKPATHLYCDLGDMQFRHVFNIPVECTIVGVIVYDDRDRIVSAYKTVQESFPDHGGIYTLTYS